MLNKINVLIIGKQKKDRGLSVITHRQIKSLQELSEKYTFITYNFIGYSLKGYFRSFSKLIKRIVKEAPHIIHAHYSLAGMLSILASRKKNVVVSFMGSDIYLNNIIFKIARWYILKKAVHIIVKSERMLHKLPEQKNISVIPNGVNFQLFKPMSKTNAKRKLGWDPSKIHILFPAGKNRYEKNYPLAKKVITELSKKHSIEFHLLENIEPNHVPTYLNAADIVILTSRWEGSSNVTKETMACNTVAVSTDVGDASELFDNIPGYFLTNHAVQDIVLKLDEAIVFIKENKEARGRQRILDMGLDEDTIAKKILNVYQQVVKC